MDYSRLTIKELKPLLKARGLPVSGKKDDLVSRLLKGEPVTTSAPTKVYLLVLIVNLKHPTIRSTFIPSAYRPSFMVSREDVSWAGEVGKKVGIYTTRENAQEAASILYKIVRDTDYENIMIVEFELGYARPARRRELDPKEIPDINWNGQTIMEWSSALGIPPTGHKTNISDKCSSKYYLVVEDIDYHNIPRSRQMEIGIYSTPDEADRTAKELMQIEPKGMFRTIDLCVDTIPHEDYIREITR